MFVWVYLVLSATEPSWRRWPLCSLTVSLPASWTDIQTTWTTAATFCSENRFLKTHRHTMAAYWPWPVAIMQTGLENNIFWVLYIYCYQENKHNSVLFTVCNCILNKFICGANKHLLRWSPHLLSLSCELPVVSIPPPSFSFSLPTLTEAPESESIWFSNREKDMKLYIILTKRESVP